MKKTLALILALLCFALTACGENAETDITSSKQSEANVETSAETTIETTTEVINVDLSATEEDQGGAEILPRKYRDNFYSIPKFFIDIVGRENYEEWSFNYLEYPDNTKEMGMVSFIKEFNISREDFDKANIEYAKFIDRIYSEDGTKTVICLEPQDYADQEFHEIYNADIIYTFDNEIISEYYLGIDYPFLNEYQYVEALEAGTYQTRTTKFITIEQMEAEFIEKYGYSPYSTGAETTLAETVAASDVTEDLNS